MCVRGLLTGSGFLCLVQILDVDIFGEEMASPENYPDNVRLASVGLVLKKVP